MRGGEGRGPESLVGFWDVRSTGRREAGELRVAEVRAPAPQPIVRPKQRALLQRSPGREVWTRLFGGRAALPALVQRSRSASDQSPVIMQGSGPISSASS